MGARPAGPREVLGIGATHVLDAAGCLDPAAVAAFRGAGLRVLQLADLPDLPEADLLHRLPDACAFVSAALQSRGEEEAAGTSGADPEAPSSSGGSGGAGGVLVHCLHGVSRAPAIAAAYLVQAEGLAAAAALAAVQGVRPASGPNAGFRGQLALWAALGGRLDAAARRNDEYRRFRLDRARAAYLDRGLEGVEGVEGLDEGGEGPGALPALEGLALAAKPEAEAPRPAAASATAAGPPGTVAGGTDPGGDAGEAGGGPRAEEEQLLYRCRRCRQLLATAAHVLLHEPGAGQQAFQPHKRGERPVRPGGQSLVLTGSTKFCRGNTRRRGRPLQLGVPRAAEVDDGCGGGGRPGAPRPPASLPSFPFPPSGWG